jgi:hypothetical protein
MPPDTTTTPSIRFNIHREPEGLWAESPRLPGWSAAAPTWDELCRLCFEATALLVGTDVTKICVEVTDAAG